MGCKDWKKHAFKLLRNYVMKGFVSDPPNLSVYAPTKRLASGWQMYRCLRLETAIEVRTFPVSTNSSTSSPRPQHIRPFAGACANDDHRECTTTWRC